MTPRRAKEVVSTACKDAVVEASGGRWESVESLLRKATHTASSMTRKPVNPAKVTGVKNTGPRYSQSLERGLSILGMFSPKRPVLGIADMADELGYSRSTTHRYAVTLVALGQLEQTVDRRYRRVEA